MTRLCISGIAAVVVMGAQQPPNASQAALNQYCVTCHNAKLQTGGLALDKLDLQRVEANAETWEKVARKLRAGHDAAGGRAPAGPAYAGQIGWSSGRRAGSRRRRESQPWPHAAASHESRRVRQRDPGSARGGRGRCHAAARRRFQRTASTTSPTFWESRPRCWNVTLRQRPRSAGWRWEIRRPLRWMSPTSCAEI